MPKAFVFGPGAGPFHIVGNNCEMVADADFTTDHQNNVRTVENTSSIRLD